MTSHISLLVPHGDHAPSWRARFDVLSAILRDANIEARAVPWTEMPLAPHTNVLALLAWGYHLEPMRWLELLRKRASVAAANTINPVQSLIWNSSKRYLLDVQMHAPIVRTQFVDHLTANELMKLRVVLGSDDLIAKPIFGASSHGLVRFGVDDQVADMRDVMVQAFVPTITTEGEVSLIFFDGVFSHAIRKTPRAGEFRVQSEFGGSIERCTPTDAMLSVAQGALRAAPDKLAYARVDTVRMSDGSWAVLELEAVEPELFVEYAEDGGAALAKVMTHRFTNMEVERQS